MTLFELMESNQKGSGPYALTDHDLAVLADWAHKEQKETPNQDWKRAYALIREGADLLLRRRARSSCTPLILEPSPNVPFPGPSKPKKSPNSPFTKGV